MNSEKVEELKGICQRLLNIGSHLSTQCSLLLHGNLRSANNFIFQIDEALLDWNNVKIQANLLIKEIQNESDQRSDDAHCAISSSNCGDNAS